MSCTPATLADQSKCLATALSTHQLYAAWAYLLCSGVTPPTNEGILTEPEGQIITTDDGQTILPEP